MNKRRGMEDVEIVEAPADLLALLAYMKDFRVLSAATTKELSS